MVAREVLPDRGSRNRKHQDRASFEVTRNASPAAFKSVTSIRPADGVGELRMSASVNDLRIPVPHHRRCDLLIWGRAGDAKPSGYP
jgi:hypothetical protein